MILGTSSAARAQQRGGGLRRIGVLAPSTAEREAITLAPFYEEMNRLGWVEGRDVTYDRLFGDDKADALPRLAQALVARAPELIYAPPQPAAVAVRKATSSIPIVFGTSTDPVGAGLVQTLARPGGNATGLGVFESMAPKQLEIARELLPRARRLGLIGDPGDPRFEMDRTALARHAAQPASLVAQPVRDSASLELALEQMVRERVELLFTTSSIVFNLRERVMAVARSNRMAVIGHRSQLADAGALFAYSYSLTEQIRRSARFVDKILRGARPADLPVEQPELIELVINLTTARMLGIQVPHSVALRAQRMIE